MLVCVLALSGAFGLAEWLPVQSVQKVDLGRYVGK
jgi:hypothetical protein